MLPYISLHRLLGSTGSQGTVVQTSILDFCLIIVVTDYNYKRATFLIRITRFFLCVDDNICGFSHRVLDFVFLLPLGIFALSM